MGNLNEIATELIIEEIEIKKKIKFFKNNFLMNN